MRRPRRSMSEPDRQPTQAGAARNIDQERPTVEIPRRQPLNRPQADQRQVRDLHNHAEPDGTQAHGSLRVTSGKRTGSPARAVTMSTYIPAALDLRISCGLRYHQRTLPREGMRSGGNPK